MNKQEIAELLRNEVGHLALEIEKLQNRCERLKTFVLDLEAEIHGPPVEPKKTILDGKFRTVIDSVFGEKPRQRKR